MTTKQSILPTSLIIAEESREDALTKRIIANLPEAEVSYVSQRVDPMLRENGSEPTWRDFSVGKRTLFLRRHLGTWLKTCPGTSAHVCCNLWVVNPGEGCPFDCTYCYLQSYLSRNPTLKLYTNTSDMLAEIEQVVTAEPKRLFRIGTGELIDSLVWDNIAEQTLELVPFFARLENAVLELKTKHNYVDNLLSLKNEHKEKTVVSWSVNAKSITEKEELNTASLTERIEAAAKVVEAGYRVGFHFDPLVYFEGWADEYEQSLADIFKVVDSRRVAWVSLSSLRYKPELQQTMLHRFPNSKSPLGEQFLAEDRKIRYIQPIRIRMQKFMWDRLKQINSNLPVYMCMESSTAWRSINGGPPAAGVELSEIFARRLPILGQA